MLNNNCFCDQRTDENPIYPPRDMLQQRSALPGIIAVVHRAVMKPYFFLIMPHTESFEGVTLHRSEFNPGKLFERKIQCFKIQNKFYYFCPAPNLGHKLRNLNSAINMHFIQITKGL